LNVTTRRTKSYRRTGDKTNGHFCGNDAIHLAEHWRYREKREGPPVSAGGTAQLRGRTICIRETMLRSLSPRKAICTGPTIKEYVSMRLGANHQHRDDPYNAPLMTDCVPKVRCTPVVLMDFRTSFGRSSKPPGYYAFIQASKATW
jgi:hypothetical protein